MQIDRALILKIDDAMRLTHQLIKMIKLFSVTFVGVGEKKNATFISTLFCFCLFSMCNHILEAFKIRLDFIMAQFHSLYLNIDNEWTANDENCWLFSNMNILTSDNSFDKVKL